MKLFLIIYFYFIVSSLNPVCILHFRKCMTTVLGSTRFEFDFIKCLNITLILYPIKFLHCYFGKHEAETFRTFFFFLFYFQSEIFMICFCCKTHIGLDILQDTLYFFYQFVSHSSSKVSRVHIHFVHEQIEAKQQTLL